MKGNLFIISCILLSLTFDACFEDEVEYEYESPNCVSVDNVSKNNNIIVSKIWKSKEIEFEILNECVSDYYIIDYNVSGDIKDIRIEGLSKNKIINSKELPFKVIISPISIGNKTINFSIDTSIGQIYVTEGIDVEY